MQINSTLMKFEIICHLVDTAEDWSVSDEDEESEDEEEEPDEEEDDEDEDEPVLEVADSDDVTRAYKLVNFY